MGFIRNRLLVVWMSLICTLGSAHADFVNFESPHVHPLDVSPNGTLLAACNTADNRVELFDLSSGQPQYLRSVVVGIDPVSVRFVSNSRALVVNHVSDSVSFVDTTMGVVIRTINVPDEPCDVVTAGPSGRAFVSCSQVNKVAVINYLNGTVDSTVDVLGEDPRALAVSPDRSKVYVAVFESGNRSTVIGGGAEDLSVIPYPPNTASNSQGPYGGVNPPPNFGNDFFPPKNPGNGPAPRVAHIVKQNGLGQWLDDNNRDWTSMVSGSNAAASGRPQGWTLLDHDLAVIDASTLAISYVDSLMNINMALSVNPVTGRVAVVGTEAINELRFEPNVNGIFVRVMMALASDTSQQGLADLNLLHLSQAQLTEHGSNDPYARPRVSQVARDKSIGDPRGIAWNAAGNRAYITGMGSNNMIVVNSLGDRVSNAATIELREAPTGVVVDDLRNQVYVLNRFHASISTVSIASESEVANLPFHDPTPAAIKLGRKHLYDTRKTSGLGQVSCASCHVDARFDRLAWDLGDPAIPPKPARDLSEGGDLNLGFDFPLLDDGFRDFHPMKGPMTTQTLVGIMGHEPFHWRGDRLGLEEFNPAFEGLLGDDELLTPQEMQQFKDFLATIHFPPNPYRNIDNSLPTNLPLPGHYATGDNELPEGTPLPNGNAVNGLFLYRGAPNASGLPTRVLDQDAFTCMTCHTLPSGDGPSGRFNGSGWTPIPPAPNGNRHVGMVSVDGFFNRAIKVPHLQPVYDKVGFQMVNRNGDKTSLAGFGYVHDGTIDSIERFFAAGGPHEGAFRFENDQEVADMVALMLAFSGSDFPQTPAVNPVFNPPGTPSLDVHAAVGKQVTFTALGPNFFPGLNELMEVCENSPRIELAASGLWGGVQRGFLYLDGEDFMPDVNGGELIDLAALLAGLQDFDALTFTVVPAGTGERFALDRDGDGYFDHTERLDGSDPRDPQSFGPQEGEVEGAEGEGQIDGEGQVEGTEEGLTEGSPEGASEGIDEGSADGEGTSEGEGEGTVEGTSEGSTEGEGPLFNSADTNQDNLISLAELLRPVQFYNARGFRCATDAESSEDGYLPGFGACDACEPYTGDYLAPKCRLSLSELLRLIQLFNVGQYHRCDTPDKFCPGPAS
ncbi:MAG: hypothetical protein RLZZ303_2806 [Candidatus Hydrogenedentota bacterium]|jgi:YVTN family beta-propeller protein